MRRTVFSFTILLLFMSACKGTSLPMTGVSTPASRQPTDTESQPSSVPSEVSIAAPTATSPQPVYDPAQLGDLGKLDSYVIVSKQKTQEGVDPNGNQGQRGGQQTMTVINSPRQAQYESVSEQSNIAGQDDRTITVHGYWVEDVSYWHSEGSDFWTIKPDGENDQDYFNPFVSPLASIKSARFVGQEVFQGIPANHFVFDQTDLISDPAQNTHKVESVQGNLYLTLDGNYPLHLDYKGIGELWYVYHYDTYTTTYGPGISETDYDLTSINQTAGINLPGDMPSQVKLEVDVPLPPGSKLSSLMIFTHGPPYNYSYTTTLSDDEIIAFYQAFQPANGWTVETAAKDPIGSGGVVILTKNGQLVTLTFRVDNSNQEETINFQYSS